MNIPARFFPLLMAGLCLTTACATPYVYSFRVTDAGTLRPAGSQNSGTVEDADVKVELSVDPGELREIVLAVTNKTDQVLQVKWTNVVLTSPSGVVSAPRPDTDLGWIPPGTTQTARLVPFALPDRGDAALAYEGRLFELQVPMVIRRESKSFRYHLAAHVQERKSGKSK